MTPNCLQFLTKISTCVTPQVLSAQCNHHNLFITVIVVYNSDRWSLFTALDCRLSVTAELVME